MTDEEETEKRSQDIEIYYAWLEVADDGSEHLMSQALPTGLVPLINADYATACALRPMVLAHARMTSHKVRLVKFRREQLLEAVERD